MPCIASEGTIESPAQHDSDEPTHVLLGAREDSPDRDAQRERLFSLVYDSLRRIAGGIMRSERAGSTLTPTVLVHELYLKLVDQSRVDWTDRARFLGIAARAMRQILVDHARTRAAAKRGGGLVRVTISDDTLGADDEAFDAIRLSRAFDLLTEQDRRAAAVAEMRLFTGLTQEEIAQALGVSRRTVVSDWDFARRWLSRELRDLS